MSDGTNRWADELRDSLRTMKDELRVQLHLAGKDANARFTELEHRHDSEQLTVRKNLSELTASFRLLIGELDKQQGKRS